jgi:hypothetical protein
MLQRSVYFSLSMIVLLSYSLAEAQRMIVQYTPNIGRLDTTKRKHFRTYHVRLDFKNGNTKSVEDIKLDPPSGWDLDQKNSKIIHNLKRLGLVDSGKITEKTTDLTETLNSEDIKHINSLMGADKPDIILDISVKVKKTSSKFSFKDEHRHNVHFKLEVYPEKYKGPHWGDTKDASSFTHEDFYARKWDVELRKKLK